MVQFLESLHKLRTEEEGKVLKKTGRTREYYYSNLSMIPDEKRYPVINILTDRKIGTLGDEFMTLHARVGLHFIMRGKVWRMVQIKMKQEPSMLLPAEDPSAAIPGWDGEILPVPFDFSAANRGNAGKNRQTAQSRAKNLRLQLKS